MDHWQMWKKQQQVTILTETVPKNNKAKYAKEISWEIKSRPTAMVGWSQVAAKKEDKERCGEEEI